MGKTNTTKILPMVVQVISEIECECINLSPPAWTSARQKLFACIAYFSHGIRRPMYFQCTYNKVNWGEAPEFHDTVAHIPLRGGIRNAKGGGGVLLDVVIPHKVVDFFERLDKMMEERIAPHLPESCKMTPSFRTCTDGDEVCATLTLTLNPWGKMPPEIFICDQDGNKRSVGDIGDLAPGMHIIPILEAAGVTVGSHSCRIVYNCPQLLAIVNEI